MRGTTRDFVSDDSRHLALRETQRHLSNPRLLGVIAIVALLLGLSGPFGSYAALATPTRLVYWAILACVSYAATVMVGSLLRRRLDGRLHHPAAWALLIGIVAGLPVTALVVAVNLVTFGIERGWGIIDLPWLWICVTAITTGATAVSIIIRRSAAPPSAPSEAPPALLQRVALPQRGPLVSLSVADHYVEVSTTKGRGLVLMRLSDAIRETHPTAGLQIHRSHWVALSAVARTLRADGRLFVELTDGRRLPISRGYLAAAREAGLRA